MTSVAWNGTDLAATYGFNLAGEGQLERGLLSLPGLALQESLIPGRVAADFTILRRNVRAAKLDCALLAADHTTLLTYRDAFVNLVGDGAMGALTVPDRASTRLMVATVEELDMPRPNLPWITPLLRFTWSLRSRIPYWEDLDLQTISPVASSITNDGDEPCPVQWTCTATDTLATGLYFEVAGERFTYSGALATNDVLVIDTELPAVRKNDVVDWANTATTAKFPWLSVGANTITKSSANFTLRADYRRWWR
jgi:hypothetical protein